MTSSKSQVSVAFTVTGVLHEGYTFGALHESYTEHACVPHVWSEGTVGCHPCQVTSSLVFDSVSVITVCVCVFTVSCLVLLSFAGWCPDPRPCCSCSHSLSTHTHTTTLPVYPPHTHTHTTTLLVYPVTLTHNHTGAVNRLDSSAQGPHPLRDGMAN